MKAAVLYELDTPLRVLTGIDLPPPARGQVKVQFAYAGVCHSQLMEIRGGRGVDRYLPHLLGHEGSGRVVEVGSEVAKVNRGDAVVVSWIKGYGLDVPSSQYRYGDNTINAGAVTTFNEFGLVSENRCFRLPPGIPLDVAVLFGCALPTGAGIVSNTIRPAPGSTIAVFGLGGIGLCALIACRLYECAELIAVDVEPQKLALAAELGATATIDASRIDPVAEIRHLTGGVGVDYSIEAAGLVRTIEQAFDAVRRGSGVCVFASHPKSGERITIDPYELICGKQIRGSWGGSSDPDRDIPRFVELYRTGKLPLEKVLTRAYKLDDINIAIADLQERRVSRPLIEIDPSFV